MILFLLEMLLLCSFYERSDLKFSRQFSVDPSDSERMSFWLWLTPPIEKILKREKKLKNKYISENREEKLF